MTLTARQRTKINAALCLIHDNGYSANAVIRLANGLMKEGADTRSAYEDALNRFLTDEPALTPVITKVLRLVQASDDGTVDQYDAALSAYVTTGDDSSLNAMAPVIAQDSVALALREGEITPEEAASGDVGKALGFEPGDLLLEAVAPTEGEPRSAPQPAQQQPQHWQQPRQDAPPQLGPLSAGQDYANSSQVSLGGGPTGIVAPNAQRHRAMNSPHSAQSMDGAQIA